MGSLMPSIVTTKLPFPGFCLLISTMARSPSAMTILLARVLNAPHCLQASTVTIFFLLLLLLLSDFDDDDDDDKVDEDNDNVVEDIDDDKRRSINSIFVPLMVNPAVRSWSFNSTTVNSLN
eukprot:CAMPEP_0171022710 /NCGR_PEP_ID=MMETSP0736-20130129/31625_1 /TAXON_ID=186038 /ORGANISM="Fragilariopsis kerguelensis, Strain L26-C5" /LENGTH=120 /DNA_ID=CAMNT_0011461659 /DNA_START=539 /DNA_END=901 /DNA_ORIENTATION=-